ncbi:BnaCnng29050D [Brassica napus]|uniref:BnaCnng29050D protein n=1 Tax=Brassica napus TaxID=3708 RepID=A0A078J157_BRANA|nr:BnaCnng29050D [Brassica napus]
MTGGPKIATVNGVWIEKSRGFSRSCKDLLVNFFKAEYAQVDFRSKLFIHPSLSHMQGFPSKNSASGYLFFQI